MLFDRRILDRGYAAKIRAYRGRKLLANELSCGKTRVYQRLNRRQSGAALRFLMELHQMP